MRPRTTSSQHGADTTDGRRRRREQGRLAVVDTVIDLMLAGVTAPTAEQIAGGADVSVASVHRYFSSLDELRRLGIQRYLERFDHLMAIESIGEGDVLERVALLVRARLDYYENTAPIARLARRRAVTVTALRDTLGRVRSTLADQIAQQFALELDALRATARRERVAMIAVMTSFESWEQMVEQGMTRAAIERAWRDHLGLMLSGAAA